MFDVDLSEIPVFRDGATTDLTYVILACKQAEVYNAVVYGRGTLKFYPNAQFWGITDEILSSCDTNCLYNRTHSGYQGVHGCGKDSVKKILERIRTQRGTTVVTEKAFDDFNPGSYGNDRSKSRSMHPATHGVPNLTSLPVTIRVPEESWPTPAQAPEEQAEQIDVPEVEASEVVKPLTKAQKAKAKAALDKQKAKDKAQLKKANDKAKADLAKLKLKEKEAAAKLKLKEKEKAKKDAAKAKAKAYA